MDLPAIILNCKTYPQVEGNGALALAVTCQRVHEETGASIAICPPTVDLSRICAEVEIPVFAQNVDIWDDGVKTGGVTIGQVKKAGAEGILINHSEARRLLFDIEALITAAHLKELVTIVCSNNVNASRGAAAMGPDFVAMEPPELIGGDTSVTSADPDIVKDTVEQVSLVSRDVKVLTGAGVKSKEDVKKALELGTHGVLLASGVVKARDPGKVLTELAEGLLHQ